MKTDHKIFSERMRHVYGCASGRHSEPHEGRDDFMWCITRELAEMARFQFAATSVLLNKRAITALAWQKQEGEGPDLRSVMDRIMTGLTHESQNPDDAILSCASAPAWGSTPPALCVPPPWGYPLPDAREFRIQATWEFHRWTASRDKVRICRGVFAFTDLDGILWDRASKCSSSTEFQQALGDVVRTIQQGVIRHAALIVADRLVFDIGPLQGTFRSIPLPDLLQAIPQPLA